MIRRITHNKLRMPTDLAPGAFLPVVLQVGNASSQPGAWDWP